MRARSSSSSRAALAIGSTAAAGMMPSSACARGQRDLDVEPCLPAVLQPVERADAGVLYAAGGRAFVAHATFPFERNAAAGGRSGKYVRNVTFG
jgi:hypothetical protein